MRFLNSCLGGLIFAVAVAATARAAAPGTRSADVQRAIAQFRAFHVGAVEGEIVRAPQEPLPDPAAAQRWATSVRDDGSWADIDYASQARSGWAPLAHWQRMRAMVITAARLGASEQGRAQLLDATHRAFGYWIAHDFQCPNWWYNEIGIPKEVGAVALLLGEELQPAELAYTTGVSLARYPIRLTGQNKVWLAGNALMRGLLLGDEAIVREAVDAIWNEVRVSTTEGIQPDFSFHQHGPQQQFGNYGLSFAVETARWALILRGTGWQLADEQLAVFRRYLLDGQAWVSWRGAMDVSACARQLMPRSPRSKTTMAARVMRQAAEFDPAEAKVYRAFVARNQPGAPNDLVGNRHFWRSDYLVHRRPAFYATLKMSSNRVIGAEVVNSENLSGYHTGDGVLLLYRDNGEYEDIFPVWDWRKLPGVTCAEGPLPSFKTAAVPRDFVGAVSDGEDGCAVLDYQRDGVCAKKGWFFAGDTIVCLGANIRGPAEAVTATTLNQSVLRGDVTVRRGTAVRTVGAGRHDMAGVSEVEHDGWRITLLDGGELKLQTGPVTGNWHRVFDNPEAPTADVTKNIFLLWLDHGRGPSAAHYAYRISPVTANDASVRVLANSGAVQAVALSGSKTAVVFWSAGEFGLPDRRRIAVSDPAVVLVGPKTLRVVDPTQKLRVVHVAVDGQTREVQLPEAGLAGTAVEMETR